MNKVHLIMPMGGAGSRFFKNGFILPKPLIEIEGKPFLYWSTKCISKYVDVVDITFVILKEHKEKFDLENKIKEHFPEANIVVLDKMLAGAVLTCKEGVAQISDDLPIVFNDCDQIFGCKEFFEYCNSGEYSSFDGALLSFNSTEPRYSFLELGENGFVKKTVEKVAISNYAICGAYYFKNKDVFLENVKDYLVNCDYSEYFMSGVYNSMIKNNCKIKKFDVDYHLSFGTPEEYEVAKGSVYFKELK